MLFHEFVVALYLVNENHFRVCEYLIDINYTTLVVQTAKWDAVVVSLVFVSFF